MRGRSSRSFPTRGGSTSRRGRGPTTSTSSPSAPSASTTGSEAPSQVARPCPMSRLAPMTTRVRKDGGAMATDADIARAAETLRRGGPVASPAETVYGLGADADNSAALSRLYAVKGRPGEHPVIVHVGAPAQLAEWAADVPVAARRLGDALWPGPLTLVVRRAARVLDGVTGGGDTVGVRVPAQAGALALPGAFRGG